MFSITITDKDGAQHQVDLRAAQLTIGRVEDNELVLPKNNVSKQHARIVCKDGRYVLADLKSTNGTYVNGRRITAPVVVREGDKIYIGDFILGLRPLGVAPAEGPGARSPSSMPSASPPSASVSVAARSRKTTKARTRSGRPSSAPGRGPQVQTRQGVGSEGVFVRPSAPTPLPSASGVEAPDGGTYTGAMDDAATMIDSAPPRSMVGGSSAPPAEGLSLDVAGAPAGSFTPLPPSGASGPTMRAPRPPDPGSPSGGPLAAPSALTPSVRLRGALSSLIGRLSDVMDLSSEAQPVFPPDKEAVLDGLLAALDQEGVLGPDLDRRFLREAAINEAVGLGPLDRLLANQELREVVVDGPAGILADVGGGLSPVSAFFSSQAALLTTVRRLLARAGAALSGDPIQRAVLPDGGQLVVMMPPLSSSGPLIAIRRPIGTPVSPEALVTEGRLSAQMFELLRAAVRTRQNVLITGPAGAGVSELLGALGAIVDQQERLLVLHGGPGISIGHPRVLVLNRAGAPALGLAQLLESAAHLRHDRLLVDDLRPQDAFAALTAASAARGAVLAMHAPSPTLALEQLELFAQLSLPTPSTSIPALVVHAVQVLVHLGFDKDGSRRVETIAEVRAGRGDRLEVRTLFRYDGAFVATEHRAGFLPR